MPTVQQVIQYAKISQYLSSNDIKKKGLFGGGVDLQLPRKIYCVRKNVQYEYNAEGVQPQVEATGKILINSIGNNGDNITVKVTDPVLGLLTLGHYTKVSGDTDTTILAAHIAAALGINSYGYSVTSILNEVYIQARAGLGSSINGGSNLSVTATTTPAVLAKAFFTPTRVSTGTVFNVTVVDPNLGSIQVGTYTQQVTDTTDTIFIANLVAAINLYGYTGQTSGSFGMYVVAAPGLGTSINGNASQIVWSGGFNSANFSGGTNGVSIIPNTLTQFSGGVTAVNPSKGLVGASNYLYALCGAYGIEAQYKVNAGGSISPVSPILPPVINISSLDFIVSNSSLIPNGGSAFAFTLSPYDYRGYNLVFNRNGIPQGAIDNGGTYFSWNPATGIFILLGGNAVTGEYFQFYPTI